MLSVEQATARIISAFKPLASEHVALDEAVGRTVAQDMRALIDQPPYPASAMDGYAVRSADRGPRRLIGEAPAGHPYRGELGAGETVRLFTGSMVPEGADAVLAQEDSRMEGALVHFAAEPFPGKFIRAAGLDFRQGAVLAAKGRLLGPRDVALLAAGDIAEAEVAKKPLVGIAATGDELFPPGAERPPGAIAASSVYGLKPWVRRWGAEVLDLGILPDRAEAIQSLAEARCDLLVTTGGASVGDHDLVRSALGPKGFVLDFWKIAMRPGKPLIFGRLGSTPLLGLPGNPVSTFVCALLFLKPAIAAMLGQAREPQPKTARLLGTLPANGERQTYLRGAGEWRGGSYWARPFPGQDSSVLSDFSAADLLIVRPPHAASSAEGDSVEILELE